MSARINMVALDAALVARLAEELELPHFIASVLVGRGVATADEARRFLTPSLERDWENPYEIQNLEAAVDRISQAVRNDESLLVFGDFDLDGMSATSIMTLGLRACGAKEVRPFIPLRFEEGYGLSQAAIERFMAEGAPALVVTVDNGIAAKHEVAHLRELGIDVVITDHHEPADLVPEGVPVVDPKQPENPSSILAGAGVALKVVQAVGARFGKPNLWLDFVDLATLGTVADLMPMVGQNRALVAAGLARINENPRPCLAALLAVAGFSEEPVTSQNLSFTLIPRLNAAGRMNNAQLALDLLLCDDYEKATVLSQELEATNTRRRVIESELAEVAMARAQEVYTGQRALVVAGEGWHEGVKGIVASRLVNRYGVPAILFTIEGDEAHGSGRSVGEVNLFEAVSSCADLLVRFGGHHAAVGVTCKRENLEEFSRRLCEYMDTLPAEEFFPRIQVDAAVDLSELTLANVEKLELLAPFGQENPNPHFLAHGVMISGGRAVGAEKNHLSCTLSDGINSIASIMFHCDHISELLSCGVALDAVFRVQIDTWRARRSVKAMVDSLRPLSACKALEACLHDDAEFISGLVENDPAGKPGCPVDELGWVAPASERELWKQHACDDPAAFRSDLIAAFLGQASLHSSQQRALEALDAGKSVLAIMGTSRGKSLIFHVFAAEVALGRGQASLFVYPLRALVSDQAFHLVRVLGSFGLEVAVLTGASSAEQREDIMAKVAQGAIDIVLTTPEYLMLHASELAALGRFGFAVVDEAHHIATSSAAFRPLYTKLGQAFDRLGNPQILAVTATATTEIAEAITSELHIDETIVDKHERTNLTLVDQRNLRKRERYLVNLVARGEKTLIYVNSRMETIALVRQLRHQEPHIASLIGFYNAGLSRAERERIENLFREGALQILVATSAFGEGIDIPGIRHVVLYNLPFSEVEFNQMSGRAGRDGNQAWVHLLFGKHDVLHNTTLLADTIPDRDGMALVYRGLRAVQREHGEGFFALDPEEVAKCAQTLLGAAPTNSQVNCGIAVFNELGLVEISTSNFKDTRNQAFNHTRDHAQVGLHVVDYRGKVNLEESARYREGEAARAAFGAFKSWVLRCPAKELEDRIRRPLLPCDERGGNE